MSVDDRLRAGMSANADSLRPETEARLDHVRRRHRRHRVLVAAVAAAVVLVGGSGAVVGWVLTGQGGGTGGRGDVAVEPTSTATSHPEIPTSNWRRVITRDELVAAGADEAFLEENLGDARRLPLVLSLSGDVYNQSGRYAGGWTTGDAGRMSYDDGGRLVLTSSSPGCRDCVTTVDWRIVGDELHLDGASGAFDAIDRVFFLGTWHSLDE